MGDFALKLDPSERITYVGKKLGEEPCPTTLKITNPTSVRAIFIPSFHFSSAFKVLSSIIPSDFQDRQACKVKCTSNEMFRIRPPVFALKPGEETVVKVGIDTLDSEILSSAKFNLLQRPFNLSGRHFFPHPNSSLL